MESRSIWDNDADTTALRRKWIVHRLPLPFELVRQFWQLSPIKRGGTRLVAVVVRRFGNQRRIVAELPGELKLECELTNTQYHVLYTHDGVYEPDTMRFVLNWLEPGSCFCDVGANWGIYSLLAARRVGRKGKVFSFEPNSEIAEELVRHASANGLEIECSTLAVSDSDGDHVRLVVPTSGMSGGATIMSSGNTERYTTTIRLDTFFASRRRPSLIKIDVEGAEFKVLQGYERQFNENCRPALVIEYTPEINTYRHDLLDIVEFLRRFDYVFAWPTPDGVCLASEHRKPRSARDANLIAIPSECLPRLALR